MTAIPWNATIAVPKRPIGLRLTGLVLGGFLVLVLFGSLAGAGTCTGDDRLAGLTVSDMMPPLA